MLVVAKVHVITPEAFVTLVHVPLPVTAMLLVKLLVNVSVNAPFCVNKAEPDRPRRVVDALAPTRFVVLAELPVVFAVSVAGSCELAMAAPFVAG